MSSSPRAVKIGSSKVSLSLAFFGVTNNLRALRVSQEMHSEHMWTWWNIAQKHTKTSSKWFNVDDIIAWCRMGFQLSRPLQDNELCTIEFVGPFMTVVPCNLSCCHKEVQESSNIFEPWHWHRMAQVSVIVYPSILDSSTCSANIWFKRPVWGRGRIRAENGKRKAMESSKANTLSAADPSSRTEISNLPSCTM